MSGETTPKRRGRPPKPEGERKGGTSLTFKARAGLREKLIEAARKAERSVSQEIEHRLQRSLELEYLDMIKMFEETWQEGLAKINAFEQSRGINPASIELVVERAVTRALERALPSATSDLALAPAPASEPSHRLSATVDLRAIIEETVEHTLRRLHVAADVEALYSDKLGPYDEPPHRSSRRRKPADAKPDLTTEDDPKS